MSIVVSRAGRPAVYLSQLRLERLPGPWLGSRAAARSLPAGAGAVHSHRTGSELPGGRAFRTRWSPGPEQGGVPGARVRGRLLKPGTYTIVPQPAAGSRRLPKAVAVAIDAQGIRPTARVRWRNCDSMDDDAISADTTGKPLPPLALRSAGLAGAERIAPPKNNGTSGKLPAIVLGWLPTVSQSPQLSALVLTLLALSMGLLVIASIEPGHLSRYHSVRVFSRHRAGIAWFGGAVFVTAILLFSL